MAEEQRPLASADTDGEGYRNMRSIGEIQTFLENFVPDISPSFAIQAMIIKPISMLINISFICYNVFELYHLDSASNYSDKTLWYGTNFIVYLEFVGLIMLIAMTLWAHLYKKHISMTIDFITLCGSWSSFKLFYEFRPQQLIAYCTSYYTQNAKQLQSQSFEKTHKLQKIKNELDHEIAHSQSQRLS